MRDQLVYIVDAALIDVNRACAIDGSLGARERAPFVRRSECSRLCVDTFDVHSPVFATVLENTPVLESAPTDRPADVPGRGSHFAISAINGERAKIETRTERASRYALIRGYSGLSSRAVEARVPSQMLLDIRESDASVP